MKQEPENSGSTVFLWGYMKLHKHAMVWGTFFSLILGLATTLLVTSMGPVLHLFTSSSSSESYHIHDFFTGHLGDFFQRLFGNSSFDAKTLFLFLPLFFISIATLRAISSFLAFYLWEYVGEQTTKELRNEVFSRFLTVDPSTRKDLAFVEKEEELAATIGNDIKLIKEYIVHFFGGIPRELVIVFCQSMMLVLISPKLCLIFFLGCSPVFLFINRFGRKLRRRALKALNDYGSLTEWLQQRLLGVETIKHFKTEELEIRKMKDLTENLYQRFYKAARVKARTSPLVEMFGIAAMVLVIFFALKEIEAGNMTGSMTVSFFTSLVFVGRSLAICGKYFNTNRECSAAITRTQNLLSTFMERQTTLTGKSKLTENNEISIRCQDVTFCYAGQEKKILKDFSYEFYRGRFYALMGPSGVGKTTLLKLILGLEKTTSGSITLFSEKKKEAKELVGYVPQDIQFKKGTIGENIAYPLEHVDHQKLRLALASAFLETEIDALPQQEKTLLGKDGASLSGGQIQRLLLARMYYHDYPIVVLDEGTSALDPEAEEKILIALKGLTLKGVTVICVTHRSSILKFADEKILFS